MSRTRAYRRSKLKAKKKKCSRYWVAGGFPGFDEPQTDKRIVGKVATTPKECACRMCQTQGESFSDIRRKQLYADYE